MKKRYYLLLLLLYCILFCPAAAVAQPIPLQAPSFIYESVVVVVCDSNYGTGWWVSNDIVVTASHVVNWGRGCSRLLVMRGPWQSSAEVLVATDRMHGDIAVLRVHSPPPGHPVLPLAASEPEPPFIVYIVGYPMELLQVVGNDIRRLSSITRVHVSTVSWFDPVRHIYEIGRTDQGNSGGPVLAPNGAVVATVNFALRGGATELFFGSSVYWIKYALRQAGVRWQELQAATYNVAEPPGINWTYLRQLEERQKGLEEIVYALLDRLYTLYSADPLFFVLLILTGLGILYAIVRLVRG